MQISAESANQVLRDISGYDLETAKKELKCFEDSLNDPYDDGSDMAGDMWLSACISACRSRICELENQSKEKP